ncbi:hypothetical protein LWI28_025801 [Acer negundo]|uniref:Pectinesterase n=1 Tax=Acer negundo TaxID=4023 RepID=A0AAD5IPF0_ACENE|nr:hypothetical protein LWI28_002027 [Acer negundo]KAI9174988.1 hypothetical protein LWI28_025801 [Acer negundo]
MSGKGSTPTAIHLAILLAIFITGHVVVSDDTTPIPADASAVGGWFSANVGAFGTRKVTLDPELVAAEANPQVIKVRQDGTGDFKKINDAIKSIPSGNTRRVIIWIGAGEYREKITIERTIPFVTFYGSPNAMPTITQSGTALQYGTVDSATVIVQSDYFVAANIIFKNSAPRPNSSKNGGQALALRISGTKAAFYKCKMHGFQDTLCDDKGLHFFKDCYIEGTVDFIFGGGKSIYLNTQLHVLGDKDITVITAQARDRLGEDVGYSFVHCQVTGTGKRTYLGRAWMSYPRVVFAYTSMTDVILPVAWDENGRPERRQTVFFAEYECDGAGADTTGRATFSKKLSEAEVRPFLTLGYIQGSKWLLPPPHL